MREGGRGRIGGERGREDRGREGRDRARAGEEGRN